MQKLQFSVAYMHSFVFRASALYSQSLQNIGYVVM